MLARAVAAFFDCGAFCFDALGMLAQYIHPRLDFQGEMLVPDGGLLVKVDESSDKVARLFAVAP